MTLRGVAFPHLLFEWVLSYSRWTYVGLALSETRRSSAGCASGGTIRVGGRVYSVPSRLIGHTVEARQHPSTVEVLYGGRVLCTMPRLRGSAEHRIDYRHIIGSLVRKPGAFARYRFREELFPSLVFRAAYDSLGRTHGERADVEYVRLLHLAATTSERRVEATLRVRLDAGDPCDYAAVQAEVRPPVPTIPVVHIPRPDLAQYDALLAGGLVG